MTRLTLTDGTVLLVHERADDLRALVERDAPGQVGLSTQDGHRVLVAVADILSVDDERAT